MGSGHDPHEDQHHARLHGHPVHAIQDELVKIYPQGDPRRLLTAEGDSVVLSKAYDPAQKWYNDDAGAGRVVQEGEAQAGLVEKDAVAYDGLSFKQHMIAGSVAGMVEHMAMFPIDTIKTRMQVLSTPGNKTHTKVLRAFASIMKSEGPLGLYRGIGAMGLGAGPAHAVYFSVYEVCKEKFGGNREGHHPFAHAVAGGCATVASDAVLTPMDVVKQRLQLRQSPYRGIVDCIRQMLHHEGFKAFYASYKTTVMMNVPFTAVHFASYEAAKKYLVQTDDEENFFTHLTAGGVAGALASAVTTPLDVAKTRLQCQGVCGGERFHNTSILAVLRQIVSQEGAGALWKGLRPRVMFHTPAAAICWSTYEASKRFLQRWNDEQEK